MAEQVPATEPVVRQSARNRFPGIVTRVERDKVMALVEIQAGPHRIVSLMSREAADELGLEPGSRAAATVKATNVVVELEETCMRRNRMIARGPPLRPCSSRQSPAPAHPRPRRTAPWRRQS